MNQDQKNVLFVSQPDSPEHFIARRFSPNRVGDCSTNAQDVVSKQPCVDLFITDEAATVIPYQCSFTYTETTKFFEHNTNTNPYRDRRSYYGNTMARHLAFFTQECPSQDRFLFKFLVPHFNRTIEPSTPIAFRTNFEQKKFPLAAQGPIHATALDQDV